MIKQLNHQEYIHPIRKNSVVIVLDNLEHLENIGSTFRLADALGAKGIIILDDNDLFNEHKRLSAFKKINKTARSATSFVQFIIQTTDEFLNENKKNNTLIALEITNKSKRINDFDFSKIENMFLIVGNERSGVSDNLLKNTDYSIHINMLGNNSSMNVSNALAIALYKIDDDFNRGKI